MFGKVFVVFQELFVVFADMGHRKYTAGPPIECFHMTSRRPYWCPKIMKRRPCWCPKPILWELNSFLMQTLSFVSINLHRCWPRESKHSVSDHSKFEDLVFAYENRSSWVFSEKRSGHIYYMEARENKARSMELYLLLMEENL